MVASNLKKIFYYGLSLTLLTLYQAVYSTMPAEGFKRFPNPCFVETGTWKGNGINQALESGSFREIHSIERDRSLVKNARKKFINKRNVHIRQGNSAVDLWDMIKDM